MRDMHINYLMIFIQLKNICALVAYMKNYFGYRLETLSKIMWNFNYILSI